MKKPLQKLKKDYLELSDFEVVIKSDGTQGLATALNEDFDIMYFRCHAAGNGRL